MCFSLPTGYCAHSEKYRKPYKNKTNKNNLSSHAHGGELASQAPLCLAGGKPP